MSPFATTSSSDAIADGADNTIQDETADNSPVSQASTLKYEYYGHVPWIQFEPRVRELCHHLWLAPIENPTKMPLAKPLRRRLEDALCHTDLAMPQQSTQASKEFVIEHLRGGSFNRVVGITTMEKDEPELRMVLRVPRGNMAEVEHDVTILQFVQEHAAVLPVPEVISYDLTRNNPLNAPYVLQKRIPGHSLESKTRSYPDLTHQQKIMFVEEFCQILVDLQAIQHPYAGRIDSQNNDKGVKEFTVGPFPFGPESGELVAKRAASMPIFKPREFGDKTLPEVASPSDDASSSSARPEHQTAFFFLMTQFGRSKHLALELHPHMVWDADDIMDRLVTVAIQMNDLGYLDPSVAFKDEAHIFCLTHYDLDPRNIMVDIQEDGALKTTGILDWDFAMFAPKWVHCRPPMLIWNWLDGGNEDQRRANDTPPTEEQQELKLLFEDLVGWEFNFCAYHTVYRLARTLFRLALYDIDSEKAYEDAETLLKDWKEYYENQKSGNGDNDEDQNLEADGSTGEQR